MLRTRLWMGAVLIALIVAALLLDGGPWFPWLFALVLVLTFAACRELLALLAPKRPQAGWICYVGIAVLLLCNWAPHVLPLISSPYRWDADPWHWLSIAFAGVVLAAFLLEMASFKEPGQSVARIGATVLIVAYLGLLPSFLIQLRWSDIAAGTPDAARSTLALALAIFIPKCCDTGAYFTGRLVGRHGMAPVLSPKKTWEGAIGGLLIVRWEPWQLRPAGWIYLAVGLQSRAWA